jgi:hypothetical protein
MKLGRFDHHPDPAIDFCVEVECIQGLTFDATHGMAERDAVSDRIFRAMQFRVGGDEGAVNAKALLRECEKQLAAAMV